MKNPLNIAISPMPPYGELAPSCGTSWSPIPNTIAHRTISAANSSFVFGARHPAGERLAAALGDHRGLGEHEHEPAGDRDRGKQDDEVVREVLEPDREDRHAEGSLEGSGRGRTNLSRTGGASGDAAERVTARIGAVITCYLSRA